MRAQVGEIPRNQARKQVLRAMEMFAVGRTEPKKRIKTKFVP